jgi:hypothetical protein
MYTYKHEHIRHYTHDKQGAAPVPLSVSTVVGALGVLGCALFGRFLLGVTRLPGAFRWLTYVTPLGYAFEVRSRS